MIRVLVPSKRYIQVWIWWEAELHNGSFLLEIIGIENDKHHSRWRFDESQRSPTPFRCGGYYYYWDVELHLTKGTKRCTNPPGYDIGTTKIFQTSCRMAEYSSYDSQATDILLGHVTHLCLCTNFVRSRIALSICLFRIWSDPPWIRRWTHGWSDICVLLKYTPSWDGKIKIDTFTFAAFCVYLHFILRRVIAITYSKYAKKERLNSLELVDASSAHSLDWKIIKLAVHQRETNSRQIPSSTEDHIY